MTSQPLSRLLEETGGPARQAVWLAEHRLIAVSDLLVSRGLLSLETARLARSISSKWSAVPPGQISEEKRVLEAFGLAEVPALALKGCLLGALVYPESNQRWRADQDLLVAPQTLPAARAVLRNLSYQPLFDVAGGTPMHQESWKCYRGGTRYVVDLHWELRNHPVLARRLEFDEQWRAAVALPEIGAGVMGQCAMHAMLNASMHWFDDLYDPRRPVGWLLDKDLLWRRLDESGRNALFDLAGERELSGLLAESLEITRRVFETPIPETYIRELAAIGRSQRPTRLIAVGQNPWRAYWFALICEPGLPGKIRRIRESLFPPGAYMRQRYPEGSSFGLAGLYWKRILRRIGKSGN